MKLARNSTETNFDSVCVLSGEGNGTPLQLSCLESPMDGGAWSAEVYGVAKSRTQLSDFTFMRWRRKWQPTPVFLPGESQGRGSLVGCHLWGRTGSDMTVGSYSAAADLATQLLKPSETRSDLPREGSILDIYMKSLQFSIYQFLTVSF